MRMMCAVLYKVLWRACRGEDLMLARMEILCCMSIKQRGHSLGAGSCLHSFTTVSAARAGFHPFQEEQLTSILTDAVASHKRFKVVCLSDYNLTLDSMKAVKKADDFVSLLMTAYIRSCLIKSIDKPLVSQFTFCNICQASAIAYALLHWPRAPLHKQIKLFLYFLKWPAYRVCTCVCCVSSCVDKD